MGRAEWKFLKVDLTLELVDGVEWVFHICFCQGEHGLIHRVDIFRIENQASCVVGRPLHLRDELEPILNSLIVGTNRLEVSPHHWVLNNGESNEDEKNDVGS